MNGKPRAHDCHHPQYPDYRDRFGEDPARFIYHMDPRHRIRGITDPDLVRAYLDIETDRPDPRQDVIAECNQRLDDLRPAVRPETEGPHAVADGGDPR